MQKISAIAAIGGSKRVLGNKGKIPWKIPEDIAHYRSKTTGHVIIMGRKTYDSIGYPLPNRTNIVTTRDPEFKAEGVIVCHTIEEAIEKARQIEPENGEIFNIGGGQVFEAAMKYTDRLYLTLVEGEYEGDAFFPEYGEFTKVIEERKSEGNGYEYTFITLERDS